MILIHITLLYSEGEKSHCIATHYFHLPKVQSGNEWYAEIRSDVSQLGYPPTFLSTRAVVHLFESIMFFFFFITTGTIGCMNKILLSQGLDLSSDNDI